MNRAPTIELVGVWRRYRVASTTRPRGLRASISRDPLRRDRDRWFWALRDVDLRVGRGEAVGLIGRNGAGKSTLLRLIGGVGRPQRGTLRVDGRIGALVDLGHEFHGDLSGRQNAELAAVVAGMERREFRRRSEEILAFADLADSADEPLRAYSDGMRARLAFSVMTHVDPDVLLVDEVLAVGDAAFQRRSIEQITRLRDRGTAVIFVSHDLGLVRRVCDRAVWLDHGTVEARGRPSEVVDRYLTVALAPRSDLEARPPTGADVLGRTAVFDAWGAPATAIRVGDGLVVELETTLAEGGPGANVRVRIVREATDAVVVDTSTPVRDGERCTRRVHFGRLDLAPGAHRVEVSVFTGDWAAVIDAAEPQSVQVAGEGPDAAPLAPPHEWRIVR